MRVAVDTALLLLQQAPRHRVPLDLLLSTFTLQSSDTLISAHSIGAALTTNETTHPFFPWRSWVDQFYQREEVKNVLLQFPSDLASHQIRHTISARSGALTHASDWHALTQFCTYARAQI